MISNILYIIIHLFSYFFFIVYIICQAKQQCFHIEKLSPGFQGAYRAP